MIDRQDGEDVEIIHKKGGAYEHDCADGTIERRDSKTEAEADRRSVRSTTRSHRSASTPSPQRPEEALHRTDEDGARPLERAGASAPARPTPPRQDSSTPPTIGAGWRVIRRRLTDIADSAAERSPETIAEQERKRAQRKKEDEAFKRERHDCRATGDGPQTQAWLEGRQVRRHRSRPR